MKAAIVAAERGHQVTIYEKNDHLGGMIDHSRYASFKWPMLNLLKYFERKCAENPNITIHLDCDPEPAWLEAQGYDVVIAATGSVPIVPPSPGIETAIPATRAFGHEEFVDDNVVIIGGGEIGVETGLHLAQQGKKVTVIEMKDVAAEEARRVHYYNMFIDAVEEYADNLNIILKATCTGIDAQGVSYRDEAGETHTVPAGTVLLAAGMRSDITGAAKYRDDFLSNPAIASMRAARHIVPVEDRYIYSASQNCVWAIKGLANAAYGPIFDMSGEGQIKGY